MLLAISILGGLAGCDDSPTSASAPEPTELILLYDGAVIESLQQEFQVDVRVLDQDGSEITGVPVSWTIGNPEVLEATGGNSFRSISNGISTLEASVPGEAGHGGGYLRKSVAVTVNQRPTALAMGTNPLSAPPGGELHLWSLGQSLALMAWSVDAMGNPAAPMDAALSWESQNESVSSVTQSGTVTALSQGDTRIQVNSAGLSGSVRVLVDATLALEVCAVRPTTSQGTEVVCSEVGLTVAEEGY